jgi:HAD superfamily hydrolase (TIGR01458 family)
VDTQSSSGGLRSRFVRPRIRFSSRRRSLEAAVGLVGRRRRSVRNPIRIASASRSRASSRLRHWLRSSWATVRTTGPTFVRRRRFWASVNEVEASTSKLASTRVSVFCACWPPGPLERDVRRRISLSGIASPRWTRIDSGRMAAILLDIDGVLHVSGEPVPGGAEAVRALRDDGHRLRFVTNNTTRARERLADDLRGLGIELETGELTTTPAAAARRLSGARVLALTMEAVREDLAEQVELVERDAEVVLLGGADESDETGRVFGYENLNRAFAELEAGARLVCLHKNRWWQTSRGPLLDAGAFVAGLEYAAGVEAEVVGKPTRSYFDAALADLGAAAADAVMVGDDIEADVGGAKSAGLRAVLVRTGKFREESLAGAEPQPDAVVDSIADVPALLREAG